MIRWRDDCTKWAGSVTYSKISTDVTSGTMNVAWIPPPLSFPLSLLSIHPCTHKSTNKQRLLGSNMSPCSVRLIVMERQMFFLSSPLDVSDLWAEVVCIDAGSLFLFISVFSSTSVCLFGCVSVCNCGAAQACAATREPVQVCSPVGLNTSSF